MATSHRPNPDPAAQPSFLEKVKFLQEHIKLVLSLAAGSLVLSVSLLQNLGTTLQARPYLHDAWILLLASVLAGLVCNYLLTVYLNQDSEFYRWLIVIFSFFLHSCFFVALLYLLLFGLANR